MIYKVPSNPNYSMILCSIQMEQHRKMFILNMIQSNKCLTGLTCAAVFFVQRIK